MSNYSSLKATINANVKQNGNQEITGAIMNSVLNAMVDSLGAGYQYKGVATPATNPGTPDYNVFYLASEAGTYTNFGGLVIGDNEVAALVYNGSWSKQTTGAATASEVSQLAQDVADLQFNVEYENTDPLVEEIVINDNDENPIVKIDPNGVEVSALSVGGNDINDVVEKIERISREDSTSTTSEEAIIFGSELAPSLKVTPDKVIIKDLENSNGFKLDFSDRDTAAVLRSYIASLDLSTMPITGNVIALGDSTVAGYLSGTTVMSLLTVSGTKTDKSVAGATIQQMQTAWTNLSAATKTAANYVFVEIGLNSLATSPLADYQTLIATIRNDTSAKIIICAMSPAHARFRDSSTPEVAEIKYNNWRYLNTSIRNLLFYGADACAWFHSIIMGDGEDNLLPQYEYSTPDHIHPNADGVKVIAWSWLSAINK